MGALEPAIRIVIARTSPESAVAIEVVFGAQHARRQ